MRREPAVEGSVRGTASRPIGGGEQAAAPVAAWIDLHAPEAQGQKPLLHEREPIGQPRDPWWLHLDPRAVAVVAYAQIAGDAQLTQVGFGALDLSKPPRSDRQAIGDPARQTGRGGGVPDGQPELAGGAPHVGLSQTGLCERRAHSSGAPRRISRAMLAEIV